MKKLIIYFMIFLLGLGIGFTITYNVMNKKATVQTENNNTIQETIKIEAKKLLLRNSMYNYVDAVEDTISSLASTEPDYIITSGNYLLVDKTNMKQVDETGNEIVNGVIISEIIFPGDLPNIGSKITINEKGKITAATFYVEGYKVTYDLIGVNVTKIEN